MAKRIAIVGAGPAWRRGVAGVIGDAGFETVELETLDAWRPGRGGSAVALRTPGEAALVDIAEFTTDHPHIPLIAVVPVLGVGEYAAAVKAGATSAIAEDDDPEAYGLTFTGALLGLTVLPRSLARTYAARVRPTLVEGWLTEGDIANIKGLASGATVAELAETAGYSEREMFRILKQLYAALGVENRTQAIIWATRHGLLED